MKFSLLLMYLFSFFLYSSAVYNQGHILNLCFYRTHTIKRGNYSIDIQPSEIYFKLKRIRVLNYTSSAYVASLANISTSNSLNFFVGLVPPLAANDIV